MYSWHKILLALHRRQIIDRMGTTIRSNLLSIGVIYGCYDAQITIIGEIQGIAILSIEIDVFSRSHKSIFTYCLCCIFLSTPAFYAFNRDFLTTPQLHIINSRRVASYEAVKHQTIVTFGDSHIWSFTLNLTFQIELLVEYHYLWRIASQIDIARLRTNIETCDFEILLWATTLTIQLAKSITLLIEYRYDTSPFINIEQIPTIVRIPHITDLTHQNIVGLIQKENINTLNNIR